jgi:hypothetical protein
MQGQNDFRIPDPEIEVFYVFNPKIVSKLLETGMIQNIHPGSGSRIRILFFTLPGSRDQKGTRIPDPQHCHIVVLDLNQQ